MNVIHVVSSLDPSTGGPARTVTHLTDTLSHNPSIASVILLSQAVKDQPMFCSAANTRVTRHIVYYSLHRALTWGWSLRRVLEKKLEQHRPSLLHIHGIWQPTNHWVSRTARRHAIPLVIHPRGMLEPWALKFRARKKRIALYLYQQRDLETAILFFATAKQEAESIRGMGLRQPIAVIPNGVYLPLIKGKKSTRKRLPFCKRNALFLSRIHPKKGLFNLIEAWARVRPVDWRLCLAGPDEGGHLAKVMRRVRERGLEASVEYVGPVEGETKKALFEDANLFVLPSFSENFGVVVAEALAHGVPVVTTRGTPWEELPQHGCGWWVEPTADALTEALQQAIGMAPAGLQTMGEKGREYARQFNWLRIARQTADVYHWMLGQGQMPDCVLTD